MSLSLENLDATGVRQAMLEELGLDVERDQLYLSKRFNDEGRRRWSGLLRDALTSGDPASLERTIETAGLLSTHEISHRKGKPYQKAVPFDAAQLLAESEFNRFYLRGLCRVASTEGKQLLVYRAKVVEKPRQESQALIGTTVDPVTLLADLRTNIGVDTALGIPAGPNSGLSCRLK